MTVSYYGKSRVPMHCRHNGDVAVCEEVIVKQTYLKPKLGFMVKPHSVWLDVGANIGAFAVWATTKRAAEVVTYEPCAENYAMVCKNTELNRVPGENFKKAIGRGEAQIDITYNPDTPARSGAMTTKGVTETVQQVDFNRIVEELQPNGIKLDAEGAELEILDDNMNLDGVDFLVMEYHARFDKSIEKARHRLEGVASQFKHCRIPRTLVTGSGDYPSWIDPICFFWNS